MTDLAERLEGVLEELTDMAMDALRRATSGDPDSAETGEALALERRVLEGPPRPRAVHRRACTRAPAVGRAPLDDGAA